MDRRIYVFFTVLVLLLSAIGCVSMGTKTQRKDNKTNFAIFLVKGAKTSEAISMNLEKLELESQPILTNEDLISYKWSSHQLKLQQGSLQKLPF